MTVRLVKGTLDLTILYLKQYFSVGQVSDAYLYSTMDNLYRSIKAFLIKKQCSNFNNVFKFLFVKIRPMERHNFLKLFYLPVTCCITMIVVACTGATL